MAEKKNQAAQAAQETEQSEREADYWLFEAPIAEMAEKFGVSIDEAVQRRVDAAVDDAQDIDVDVRLLTEPKGGWIAMATVTTAGLSIDGFKVFNGENGLFVGPPTQRQGNQYKPTARISDDMKEVLNEKALVGYQLATEKLAARAKAAKAIEVRPHSIKEEVAKAEEKAAQQNSGRGRRGTRSRARAQGDR